MRRSIPRSRVIALLLLAAAGVAVGLAVRARLPRGSNVEQIRALLIEGERAVESRDVAAAMRLLSDDYRDGNGLRKEQVRFYAARLLRESETVAVNVSERSIEVRVDPDARHAVAACDVSLALTGRGGDHLMRHFRLKLTLRREPARVFGVFPTHAWRVLRADGYGAAEGWGF